MKLPTQEGEDELDLRRALRSSTRRKTLTYNPPPQLQGPISVDEGSPKLCRMGQGDEEEQHPLAGRRGPPD